MNAPYSPSPLPPEIDEPYPSGDTDSWSSDGPSASSTSSIRPGTSSSSSPWPRYYQAPIAEDQHPLSSSSGE